MSKKRICNPEPSKANAVQRLVESGLSFALFRLPDTEEPQLFLMTDSEAKPIDPDEKEPAGFIFAPFSETTHRPTLLFESQVVAKGWEEIIALCMPLESKRCPLNRLDVGRYSSEDPIKDYFYRERFDSFLWAIAQGKFEKLVLSRCRQDYYHDMLGQEGEIYVRATEQFPHCMVSLVYSPTCGRWIGATPELLAGGKGQDWETMALAGTHAWGDGEWDAKNVHEQDVVTRYLAQTLEDMGAEYKCNGPYTSMAGKLMHRRTDFTFHLSKPLSTMEILRTLHPTPAVCGMPKERAQKFIHKMEHQTRNYYSGYLGPINHEGETRVYVNLRCANIRPDATYYYAGGGLNQLSRLYEEAQEIDRKMQALRDLVH